jgi:hypothetical protein
MSHFDGLLIICLSSSGRPVKQAQNCLACVKLIASLRPDVCFGFIIVGLQSSIGEHFTWPRRSQLQAAVGKQGALRLRRVAYDC